MELVKTIKGIRKIKGKTQKIKAIIINQTQIEVMEE